jgi:membrane-associated HD superfamily phosphohydrolase
MSLRIIPLMIIPFILYNVIALMGGGGVADDVFRRVLFKLPMINNPNGWSFSWGDLIILITMVTLFIELLKSTYTSTSSMVDHGLSMLVFIACLIQFIISPTAQTSVFFFVMIAALIDVVAGFMIGIRTARRDLNIGSDS